MRDKVNTLGVCFIVKKNKGKDGEAPLYLRIREGYT